MDVIAVWKCDRSSSLSLCAIDSPETVHKGQLVWKKCHRTIPIATALSHIVRNNTPTPMATNSTFLSLWIVHSTGRITDSVLKRMEHVHGKKCGKATIFEMKRSFRLIHRFYRIIFVAKYFALLTLPNTFVVSLACLSLCSRDVLCWCLPYHTDVLMLVGKQIQIFA